MVGFQRGKSGGQEEIKAKKKKRKNIAKVTVFAIIASAIAAFVQANY